MNSSTSFKTEFPARTVEPYPNASSSKTKYDEHSQDSSHVQRPPECYWLHVNGPDIGENDVVLGRGIGKSHEGNLKFRGLIRKHKLRYRNACKARKPRVAEQVVQIWRSLDPPGRFLARKEMDLSSPAGVIETGVWYDVGDKRAREKASMSLRERSTTDYFAKFSLPPGPNESRGSIHHEERQQEYPYRWPLRADPQDDHHQFRMSWQMIPPSPPPHLQHRITLSLIPHKNSTVASVPTARKDSFQSHAFHSHSHHHHDDRVPSSLLEAQRQICEMQAQIDEQHQIINRLEHRLAAKDSSRVKTQGSTSHNGTENTFDHPSPPLLHSRHHGRNTLLSPVAYTGLYGVASSSHHDNECTGLDDNHTSLLDCFPDNRYSENTAEEEV